MIVGLTIYVGKYVGNTVGVNVKVGVKVGVLVGVLIGVLVGVFVGLLVTMDSSLSLGNKALVSSGAVVLFVNNAAEKTVPAVIITILDMTKILEGLCPLIEEVGILPDLLGFLNVI